MALYFEAVTDESTREMKITCRILDLKHLIPDNQIIGSLRLNITIGVCATAEPSSTFSTVISPRVPIHITT
jgi:hypothetical protein